MKTVAVPANLEALVDPLIGSPFLALGRTPAGWDCAGTVEWIWREFLGHEAPGLSPFYSAEVAMAAGRRQRAELIASGARAYVACGPRAGTIVRLRRFDVVGHIGVMLDAVRFVHTDHPTGTAIGDLNDPACAYSLAGCVVPAGVLLVGAV